MVGFSRLARLGSQWEAVGGKAGMGGTVVAPAVVDAPAPQCYEVRFPDTIGLGNLALGLL